MSDDSGSPEPHETLTFTGEIDRLCERFETAWKSGKPPSIEDYLDIGSSNEKSPPVSELLTELVRIDVDYRWRFADHGTADQETSKTSAALPKRPRLEDYIACHPPLGSLEEVSETLIAAEYRSRHRWGDKPSHNEYVSRFGSRQGTLIELLSGIDEELASGKKREDSDLRARTPTHETPEGLHVRCPHCRNPIEIVDDTPVAEINCPSCGSSFNLVGEEALTLQTLGGTRRRRRTIGHFELLEQLGSGAFGAVWKARDTQLDRIVAIKTPRKGQLDREETEKVLREARAAAQLRHPNIVSVHEVGLDGELIYTVSDFIEGVSLHDWLTGQKFTHREAVELCAKVADAIHFAHEQGVIHRDLKPSNIMLDPSGEPHIMDFGLAKREAGEITMTMEGQILGTPAYMSPEQAKGEGHSADRRTDVYSLGVILFELLTAECPFRGNMRMLIKQVVDDESPSPRKLDGTISRDLETICLKCLEKDPAKRYQTAGELGDELRRFLSGEPIHARPISTVARVWRWCKRRPTVAALSATAALLVVLVAVVASTGYFREAAERHRAETEKERAEVAEREALGLLDETRTSRKEAEQARHESELALADMYTSYGLIAAERGNPQEAVLWFANAAEKARNDPERDLANRVRFRSWCREFPTPIRVFEHSGEKLQKIEFDPRGQYLMVHDQDSGPTIWHLETTTVVKLAGDDSMASIATWNSTGERLALADLRGGIAIADFPQLEQLHHVTHSGKTTAMNFSSDDRYLAIASDKLRVWDCHSKELLPSEVQHPGPVVSVLFTSDNRYVVTSCRDNKCRVFAFDGKRLETEPCFPPVVHLVQGFVGSKGFSPMLTAGGGLVTWQANHSLRWVDVSTGKEVHKLDLPPEVINVAKVGHDGNLLVHSGYGFKAQFYDLAHRGSVGDAMGHQNHMPDVAFSPDDRVLLTGSTDQTARLWSVPSGKPLSPPLPHQGEIYHVAYSPEGNHFATAQTDGMIRVWKLPEPREDRRIPIGVRHHRVAVTTDGKFLMPVGSWRSRDLYSTRVYDVRTGEPAGPAFGCGELINGGAFSRDARYAITLHPLPGDRGRDGWHLHPGTIDFWNWRTGQRAFDSIGAASEPLDAACSPDGKLLVVVCAGGQILTLDLDHGTVIRGQNHPGRPDRYLQPKRRVQFTAGGTHFVTLGFNQTVCVWETATGELCSTVKHAGIIFDATFSPDGRRLVTASEDKTARIWDATTGQEVASALHHSDWVFSARFSPDARYVLTASRDHMVRLWDWRTARLARPALEHEDEAFAAVFAKQGPWLLTVSRDGDAGIWEWQTGKAVAPSKALTGASGDCILVMPDGRSAVITGNLSSVEILDLQGLDTSDWDEMKSGDLQTLGEILSARRVEGGGTVKLNTDEWFQRWKSFRKNHPTYHQFCAKARENGESNREVASGRTHLWQCVSELRNSSSDRQEKAFTDLKAFLSAREVLTQQDLDLALSTARALEASKQPELPARAYNDLARMFSSTSDKRLAEQVRSWEGIARRLTLPGKRLELAGARLDGTEFDWGSYGGRVVLVVFWATWSDPNGLTMARLKMNYELYHDRGFDMVTISLDRDRRRLEQYLEDNSFPRTVLHGKDSGGMHPMAAYYGITATPVMFLVGRDGKVISTQSRGSQLDKQLRELLGPPYAPTGMLTYIDLQPETNQKLTDSMGTYSGNDFSELPRGEGEFEGVKFNISEGLIQLGSQKLPEKPEKVGPIAVNRRLAKLYILHGTQYGGENHGVGDGTVIGQYKLHYEDGDEKTIDIACGEDVRDWWHNADTKTVTRGRIAWMGGNEAARRFGSRIGLYLAVWENPDPDKMVASIDYISTMTNAAPFCAAMTVEGDAADEPADVPAEQPAEEPPSPERATRTSPNDEPLPAPPSPAPAQPSSESETMPPARSESDKSSTDDPAMEDVHHSTTLGEIEPLTSKDDVTVGDAEEQAKELDQ